MGRVGGLPFISPGLSWSLEEHQQRLEPVVQENYVLVQIHAEV